jgi:hypothetical protein
MKLDPLYHTRLRTHMKHIIQHGAVHSNGQTSEQSTSIGLFTTSCLSSNLKSCRYVAEHHETGCVGFP